MMLCIIVLGRRATNFRGRGAFFINYLPQTSTFDAKLNHLPSPKICVLQGCSLSLVKEVVTPLFSVFLGEGSLYRYILLSKH